MTNSILASKLSDYMLIAKLAKIVWQDHYIPIIGEAQVTYMLKKFQSVEAIIKQIEDGFEYYVLNFEDIPVGYFSIIKKGDALFLSKIYVLKEYRGKQIGKVAMQFIEDRAKALYLNKIRLTVNKNNNAKHFYERIGFINKGSIVMDIGNGFVMDDYLMMKSLQKNN